MICWEQKRRSREGQHAEPSGLRWLLMAWALMILVTSEPKLVKPGNENSARYTWSLCPPSRELVLLLHSVADICSGFVGVPLS